MESFKSVRPAFNKPTEDIFIISLTINRFPPEWQRVDGYGKDTYSGDNVHGLY